MVDGFLFQVADKNPEIVEPVSQSRKIIKFRTKLQRIGSSVRSIDRDDAIYSATFKYTEEEKLVLESLRELKGPVNQSGTEFKCFIIISHYRADGVWRCQDV